MTCTESGCQSIDIDPATLMEYDGTIPRIGAPRDAGTDAMSPMCTPRTEVCNGVDDDCDGMRDDGFDLSSDASNCGACNNRCPGGGGAVCCAGVCDRGSCP